MNNNTEIITDIFKMVFSPQTQYLDNCFEMRKKKKTSDEI